ncbi:hypothetical protein AsAng_0048690 [Aureispira anguillae]|uniref:Uncharacterized protein n=1 Tax=Aureispira anguillae TaxID=2864201 RepID=A0A915YJ11_9BACT|nr:hypothetical protein AsAng_0048690 [Aureispira anguillae]
MKFLFQTYNLLFIGVLLFFETIVVVKTIFLYLNYLLFLLFEKLIFFAVFQNVNYTNNTFLMLKIL